MVELRTMTFPMKGVFIRLLLLTSIGFLPTFLCIVLTRHLLKPGVALFHRARIECLHLSVMEAMETCPISHRNCTPLLLRYAVANDNWIAITTDELCIM